MTVTYTCHTESCGQRDLPKSSAGIYDVPVLCGECGQPTQLDPIPEPREQP